MNLLLDTHVFLWLNEAPEKLTPIIRQTCENPDNSLHLSIARKNQDIRTTRDLLLPKLISGELDVSKLPDPEDIAA